MATCETCRFGQVRWREGDTYMDHGFGYSAASEKTRSATSVFCRRYAPRGPVVYPGGCEGMSAFPDVAGDDWCGEYQPNSGE